MSGESVRRSRRNCRQRQNTTVTWKPPLLRARSSLDPRETPSGDCGQTRKVPRKLKEITRRVSFCQDTQYCGIFLQVAVPVSVSLPKCCLLDLLWRNFGLRVARPEVECVTGWHDTLVTMRLWICFTECAQNGAVVIMVVRERFLVHYIQWYLDSWLITTCVVWRQKFANWRPVRTLSPWDFWNEFVVFKVPADRFNVRVLHWKHYKLIFWL